MCMAGSMTSMAPDRSIRRAVIAVLGAAVFGGLPVQPTLAQAYSTALTVENGWPVATVSINGEPLRFIIDTGAGGGVIDAAVAERLKLPTSGDKFAVVGASSGSGGGGALASTVEIAGAVRENESFVIADMSQFSGGFAGIFGNHFFKHYAFVSDVPNGRLELFDADRAPRAGDMTCVPNALPDRSEPLAGFAIVQAKVQLPGTTAAVPLTVIIDSGAKVTQVNWAAGRAMGLSPGDPRVTEKAGSRGLNAATPGPSSYSFQMDGFEIAGWRPPATEVRLNDLSIFQALGLASTPAVILGANMLNQRAYSISKGAAEFCVAV